MVKQELPGCSQADPSHSPLTSRHVLLHQTRSPHATTRNCVI